MFGGWGGAIASSLSGIFGGAVSAVTDAVGHVTDAFGAGMQTVAGEAGRLLGEFNSLGAAAVTKAGLESFVSKGGVGAFAALTAPVQSILGNNLQCSFSWASNAASSIKAGGFGAAATMFFNPTNMSISGGCRIGPFGISLDKNGISVAGVKGYVDAKVQAALPSYADHIIRGAGLGPLVGTALTSKAQAQDIIDGFISAGKTVTTALSSRNIGIAVGSNMATVTINGKPIGGSTSALAKKLPAVETYGSMGGASGMPTIKITTALPGGSTIGVSQNTYATNLFNPAAYNTGELGTGGIYAGGTGPELAASISASDYITEGIIDAVGNIEAAEVGSLSATAGTVKGGAMDAHGDPEGEGLAGGTFGGGDNSNSGGTASDSPGPAGQPF